MNQLEIDLDTVTLVFVHVDSPPPAIIDNYLDGVDEVIEVVAGEPLLQAQAEEFSSRYRHINMEGNLGRQLNTGISYSSSKWIILDFSDRPLSLKVITKVKEIVRNSDECIHLLVSANGLSLPNIVVRRKAFVYGAIDAHFACQRLCALHWVHKIFPSAKNRCAPCEGIRKHRLEWISDEWPEIDHPASALIELWHYLGSSGQTKLLDQALRFPEDSLEERGRLLEKTRMEENALLPDPYKDGEYKPRQFWEENTSNYIKWEVYQPDETEILDVVQQISPDKILEVGCGPGRNIRYFLKASLYVGADLAANLLRRAKVHLDSNSKHLLCADATSLCFKDNTFDLVFSDSTIQHIEPERITQCVNEIVRVSSKYVCLIEYTDEIEEKGRWFDQIHMFRHDYGKLFGAHCSLVVRRETCFSAQPAIKQLFLFTIKDS